MPDFRAEVVNISRAAGLGARRGRRGRVELAMKAAAVSATGQLGMMGDGWSWR